MSRFTKEERRENLKVFCLTLVGATILVGLRRSSEEAWMNRGRRGWRSVLQQKISERLIGIFALAYAQTPEPDVPYS